MLNDISSFFYLHFNAIFLGIALSPIWSVLEGHSSSFFNSTVTGLVIMLWFLDLLSRWVAKYLSPTEKISIQASQHSIINLFIWLIVLAVAYCFRVYGAPFAALPIEGASIMILGASVLKNVASSSDYPLLRKIADQFSRELETKAQAMTTVVTVEPQQPPAPPIVTVTTALPAVAAEEVKSEAQPSEEVKP